MQQSTRICPTCHRTVDSSLKYCPFCQNPVDPALLDDLRWMYRVLQDLDRRIALGEGSTTIQALRDDINGDYLAKRTALGAAGSPKEVASIAALPRAALEGEKASTAVAQGFSWSAFFAEQSIAILAYTGAFLLLVATLSFEVGGWQVLNDTAKLAIVVAVYALFGIAGLVLLPRPRMRTISQTYLGIFALMTPLVGLAAYQFEFRAAGFSVQGVVSATAWYTTLVYLALALRTRYQHYSYMGWIVGVLAAESILLWANVSGAWCLFILAVSAIVLLTPPLLRLPDFFASPALVVSLVVSVLLAIIMAIVGLIIALQSLDPYTGMQQIQHPFTVAMVPFALLACFWSIIARSRGLRIGELLELATLALVIQTIASIGGDLNISRIQMGDLLAVLAVLAGATALAYRRLTPDRRTTHSGAWGLALILPLIGWLFNASLPDPNQPLLVCLGIGAMLSFILVVSEKAEWWLVYGGLAILIVFHSVVAGILVQSGHGIGTTEYAIVTAWALVGLTVVFWIVSLGLTLQASTEHLSRPAYMVAAVTGLYSSLLLIVLPYFQGHLAYETLTLAGFTALALVAGLRDRTLQPASQIGVGVFGFLTLVPYLLTSASSASYWEWFLPPVAAALVAVGVRAWLGRGQALPLYIVALVGLLIGQVRLFSDPSASSAGPLGFSPAIWFTLIFGILGIAVAVIEDHWWVTVLPAYCALVASIATEQAISGYLLTLAVVAISILLRSWRGRWWNIALLSASVLMAMIEISIFRDSSPHAEALKLGFLAVTALAGYITVVLDRGYPETVIAASLLIFLPMFTQSVTSDPPVLFTSLLALEAVAMTVLGVGMRARGQMFIGSGFVALAALRGAVLAYSSGVPIAVIIAGLALFLLAVATWLSLQARALATTTPVEE
jgi:hypothetical protein